MTDIALDLQQFESIIGVEFTDPLLLRESLTHRSYINEYDGDEAIRDNERLEFLGDAILDVVVAEMLFKKYPDMAEGELTQLRSALVRTESLAMLGAECHIGEYLLLGNGEINSGGRTRTNNLCRGFEALIGAMYLDLGMAQVEAFTLPRLEALLAYILKYSLHKDARSELQEQSQEKLSITPVYRVTNAIGPDHAKEFQVEVLIGEVVAGQGIGTSKRTAAQSAARSALERLTEDGWVIFDNSSSNN